METFAGVCTVPEIAEITSRSVLRTTKTIGLQSYYTSFFVARARGEKGGPSDFEIDFVAPIPPPLPNETAS